MENRHKEAVERKAQRIQMYQALLDTWGKRDDADYDYIKDLKRRLRSVETQFRAMKP
jgi:hypothetical protein